MGVCVAMFWVIVEIYQISNRQNKARKTLFVNMYSLFYTVEPSDRFYPAVIGMLNRLCEVFVAHEV